ncbi:dipeptidyl-peptidase-4 [Xylanibacter ruminicola]|uniref:Dipeptidyl-peptidase-4 n=1 Tax=Xylanibacter ruminicola TaxID=839 RepID=A0A1H5VDN7_XYLRU|nr:DPP IV N-terminal domain-containing protein [Xylanibacter ruminicola]SEF85465.1 dipeptidyl-peptidase-4 [Xylanibacter ruminicola]
MTRIKQLLTTTLLLAASMTMSAQNRLFSLEDLNFGGNNYYRMQPRDMFLTWWGERLVQTDVEECYLIDTKTGEKHLLFTLDDINTWAESDSVRYVRHLMNATFPYPSQPIVAVGNRKAFILVDFEAKKIVWQDSISGQEANDWNAQSRATAYVENHQLFIADAQGKKHQLSTDGSREIVYGQSVHRNEFGINKGTFWSPDGMRLAFYRMDQSMVTDYPQVDIFPREATHEPDKYPMAGMTSHKVTVGVYDLQSQQTVYLQAGDPTDRYFTNIAWSPDSKTVYILELNRGQNDCRLVSYNAITGERIAELYRETSDKYVEPQNPIQFLPWDDTKFILQSEKDGYNHLYLFDVKGKELKQLTKGPWVVMEVVGFNRKSQSIIIRSNELSPLQSNLYAVNVKTGKRTLLDRGIGVTRSVSLSASGQQAVEKFSAPDIPRIIDIVNTSNGKRYELLNAEDPWQNYQQPIFETGSIKAADGLTDLYFRMVKPADFDASKKYPTVVYVYGGPHAHNVDASWHWMSRSWETYMAQKGYILFILDNRGSENRGRDFEQATFHQLGQIEMQDQMKGVDYLRTLPYVDMDRLGVHGWSFGGFMTISLMTNYPDVFKVGVAGGPVIDWKWYEVMYGERYMGTPENNPEGYARTSLLAKAKNLKGKLQIITGYNDNTVVPQHCLSFLDACIKAGTQPDFFAYPGEEHNMRGHASVHLHERITQYFEDYLKVKR